MLVCNKKNQYLKFLKLLATIYVLLFNALAKRNKFNLDMKSVVVDQQCQKNLNGISFRTLSCNTK